MYGGAAGGGKSWALLKWLAEGIGVPGYSGILFRRTYPQLAKSGDSIIAKSHEMFRPLGGQYTESKGWVFPSGARIEFGHLQHVTSIYDYLGAAFHRMGFDELTTFTEDQYLYLFSRLRRMHGFPIAPGMRATSNPGSIGHEWVKARFITEAALKELRGMHVDEPTPPGLIYWPTPARAFVPARIADNPYLDRADYVNKLRHLDPTTRERLMNGDWSIMATGIFRAEWLRYYVQTAQHFDFYGEDKKVFFTAHETSFRRFVTVDTRGTSRQIDAEARGKPHSWSVAEVWDQTGGPNGRSFIALRHVARGRWSFPEMKDVLRKMNREWRPNKVIIEDAAQGKDLWPELKNEMPIELVTPVGDKEKRSYPLQNMMSEGRVFLPLNEGEWKPAFESELLSWLGQKDQTNDQIDAAAYAAMEAESFNQAGSAVDFDVTRGTAGLFAGARF